MKKLVLSLALVLNCIILADAQVSGTVFRDFNGNGVKNNTASFNEPGLGGITINAYDAAGALIATQVSSSVIASLGNYSFPSSGANSISSGKKVRLEFVNLNLNDYPSAAGGTSVQFVTSPATGADFGVVYPDDYCQSDPKIVVDAYESGANTTNTNKLIYTFNYSSSGTTPAPSTYIQAKDIGSVWGLAYQKKNKRIFMSTFLKRHAGMGPRGVDGVYIVDNSTNSPSLIGGFDLQGIVPGNGGAAIDLGTVNRTVVTGAISSGAAGDNQLPTVNTNGSVDLDAFAKVGKTSFGGTDVTEEGDFLWLVNLNQRALIRVALSSLVI